MATIPFGAILETALKSDIQGGKITATLGITVDPIFHCCISGTTVQVAKDPVALMTVSARRICPLLAVTVNYSHSYSPSSTLNSWTVDWGDGNVSTGAWPGAGSVNHPLGGYQLPGHYHIVLTVTDLLGATGQEHAGITVEDCIPPVALMGGCGASGSYYTSDSGVNWLSSGGGEIEGVLIRDIKATYQSIGSGTVHMWAATEQGLYRGEKNVQTGEQKWKKETLPVPTGYIVLPDVYSVTCSRFIEGNVMVLVADNATSHCWLYRGEWVGGGSGWMDATITWTYVLIQTTQWVEASLNSLSRPSGFWANWHTTWGTYADNYGKIYIFGEYYKGGAAAPVYRVGWYNAATGTWDAGIITNPFPWDGGILSMCADTDNNLYFAGIDNWHPSYPGPAPAGRQAIFKWNGSSLSYLPPVMQRDGDDQVWTMVYQESTGRLYIGGDSGIYSPINSPVQYLEGGTWHDLGSDTWVSAWEQVASIAVTDDKVYVGGSFMAGDPAPGNLIAEFDLATNAWRDLGGVSAHQEVHSVTAGPDGSIYVGGWITNIGGIEWDAWGGVARWNGVEWSPLGTEEENTMLNNDAEQIVVSESGNVYAAGIFTGTIGGIALDHVARWDAAFQQWRPVPIPLTFAANPAANPAYTVCFDGDKLQWYAGDDPGGFPDTPDRANHLAPLSSTFTVPSVGFPHLLDLDASGQFVYVCLLDAGGFPIVVRSSTAFTLDLMEMLPAYTTGAGTWAGVACDPYFYETVWAYGDFGAVKVTRTDDYGQTWADQTDGTWGGGEVVRPLLISYEDSGDVIAILNAASQVWQKWGMDNPWVHRGASPFPAACGCRNYIEPMDIWLGLNGAGAAHIQYSPNEGVNWIEHSGDFPAAVPVNALTIVGGQDYWT